MNKAVRDISHAMGWLRYVLKFKRLPSLASPQDLNEKIMWLSRHADLNLWARLADKYAVREFVKERGLEEILIPLYGHYDSVEEIDFDALPDRFVIKPTSGSGNVAVVTDKSAMGADAIKAKLRQGTNRWFGLTTGEPHYLDIRPGYIAEKLLTPDSVHGMVDYKFWCFNGKAHSCLVCADRDMEQHTLHLVSYTLPDWEHRPDNIYGSFRNNVTIARPEHLERMIQISERLSAGFPCVRVDLYEADGKVYFGEMTFTSNGGRMRYFTDPFLLEMGREIKLA